MGLFKKKDKNLKVDALQENVAAANTQVGPNQETPVVQTPVQQSAPAVVQNTTVPQNADGEQNLKVETPTAEVKKENIEIVGVEEKGSKQNKKDLIWIILIFILVILFVLFLPEIKKLF